jgi:hypothetical protein
MFGEMDSPTEPTSNDPEVMVVITNVAYSANALDLIVLTITLTADAGAAIGVWIFEITMV